MKILDDFNISCYASVVLGSADIIWIIRDISHNGFDGVYAVIATLFLIGNIGLALGLRSHYNKLNRLKCKKDCAKVDSIEAIENEIRGIYND